jgi:predicted RNA-binding Zn-ribbon protein involved in translation (DUF1610 family)
MTKKPKGGFYIGVTCPGCGAGLELQSDFFVLECSHCGSVLRVVMPDTPPAYVIEAKKEKRKIRFRVDRYLKERGQPLTKSDFTLERIYYPYWKVDGLQIHIRETITPHTSNTVNLLSMQVDGIDMTDMGRLVGKCLTQSGKTPDIQEREVSVKLSPYHSNQIAGPVLEGIPYSLGMRTSYVKMSPYMQDNNEECYKYLPVTKPWSEVLAQLSCRKPPKGLNYADPNYLCPVNLFQTEGCIVYFPFCICRSGGRRLLVDGLTGRVEHDSHCRQDEEEPVWPDPHLQFGRLNVILHRCPTCGIDLPATQSRVYICHNCHTVVSLDYKNPMDGGVFLAEGVRHKNDALFPFWVFKLHRKTVARIAKLSVMEPAPNRLVVPAFRIANFKVVRRLTQRITAAFSHFPNEAVESFDKRFRPVDLSLSEAVTLAEICLFCEKATKNPRLSPDNIKIHPRETNLFYAPFHRENYFYVDSVINAVTFAKNTIAL